MATLTIILILLSTLNRLVYGIDEYLFSNFHIKPDFAILNSTSISKFICTKQNDDNRDFEISTIPVISSDNLNIYEHRRNRTSMDIIVDSNGYIGAFRLICSTRDNQSVGIPADVYIGSPPGEFKHIKPCIVYEDRYIDCTIHMPNMIPAIHNQYPYVFDFTEIDQSSSEEKVYKKAAELVKIDDENQTITFRWIPVDMGVFPPRLKMLISGTLKHFGTRNLTIDMTPNYWIQPNFTIESVSSSSFQIQFNHDLPLICRGNLTSNNQKDNIRRFQTTNPTVVYIDQLSPNTWYQLCIQCRRDTTLNTIGDVQCLRKQTKRSWIWPVYLILISVLIIIIIIDIIIYLRPPSISTKNPSRNHTNHVITISDQRDGIQVELLRLPSEQSTTTAEPNRETDTIIAETRV